MRTAWLSNPSMSCKAAYLKQSAAQVNTAGVRLMLVTSSIDRDHVSQRHVSGSMWLACRAMETRTTCSLTALAR